MGGISLEATAGGAVYGKLSSTSPFALVNCSLGQTSASLPPFEGVHLREGQGALHQCDSF